MRSETPIIIRKTIEATRYSTGPRIGSIGHANVTNATASAIGKAFKYGGRALIAGSLVYDSYQIISSPKKARKLMAVSFGNLGAIGVGTVGAFGGSFITPIGGTIAGGVVGAAAGGHYGQKFGGWFFDSMFPGYK